MITIEFDEKTGILKSVWAGDIDLNQIVAYIDSVRTNKDYPRRLKILSDSTKANFTMKPDDLPKIVEANVKSLRHYDAIVDAMITVNPYDTAISVLYLNLSSIERYFFKVFSTTKAGLDWLNKY